MFSSMLSLLGSLRGGGGASFVTNSLRFRANASAYLSRTPSFAGNSSRFTWSGWVKRGALSAGQMIFGCTLTEGTAYSVLNFNSADTLQFTHVFGGVVQWSLGTSQVFRDSSAWYHIVAVLDTGNTTPADRVQLYVNGSRITSFSSNTQAALNASSYINSTNLHAIGRYGSTQYFDGYITEVNFIDGQALTPASFGAINSSTGVWAPSRYTGAYGTNGFYLKFADTSSVAALGNDSSVNGNNWTPTNVSLTAGQTYDSMIDVPVNYSDGGNGRGNYAVLNPVNAGMGSTIVSANLTFQNISDANQGYVASTLGVNSNAFYFELSPSAFSGILEMGLRLDGGAVVAGYRSNGTKDVDNVNSAYGSAWIASDTIGCAFDASAKSVTFYKNNVSQGAFTYTSLGAVYPSVIVRGVSSASGHVNFGQRPFIYTPPAGFRALNTNNLPTPSIVNGANYMAATTYTGNAAARSLLNTVNNVSFQPDLVWIKSRTPGATSHALFDSVRGVTNYLSSNLTTAEATLPQSLTAFNADGFSLGTDTTLVNASANSYIAWQWKESALAGLDVASYTGTGVDRTVAHNLGVAPAMVIVKRSQTGGTGNWQVRHTSIAAANSIQLNLPNAAAAATTVWANTTPSSSVFTVGSSTDVNASGISYVAYCFAEIAGFSRFGSYTGNGLADGPFAFCNFRPKWVMYKSTTEAVANWHIFDATRNTYNYVNEQLSANTSTTATVEGPYIDILSNGFKLRTASTSHNAGGVTYIFAAFAETPSKYALAR